MVDVLHLFAGHRFDEDTRGRGRSRKLKNEAEITGLSAVPASSARGVLSRALTERAVRLYNPLVRKLVDSTRPLQATRILASRLSASAL